VTVTAENPPGRWRQHIGSSNGLDAIEVKIDESPGLAP
jgi:hypothetical protein